MRIVQDLSRRVIEALRRSTLTPEDLAVAGSAQPVEDVRALEQAAHELTDDFEHWVPGLLVSASPGSGARNLVAISRARREHTHAGTHFSDHPLAPTLVGNSAFLSRWLVHQPGWLDDLRGELVPPPEKVDPGASWSDLRRAKYRGLLRVAGRDLAGRPFSDGLGELSGLADGTLRRGLELASEGREAPALFALGKLGGRELNFSSDVDLLFVCHAPPDARGQAARSEATEIIQTLKRELEEPSEDGFGYRVDLDLRPEGPAGDLVRSAEATLVYYESRGAEWERQMLLRIRYLGGSLEAARDFGRGIEPFIYRKSIDPGVIASVRAMKLRIERERRASGRDLDANLKEAPGGIRDVEFTVQALQLFHAGRLPELRTGNVLEAIAALAAAGVLPENSAAALDDGYRWLRRAEHALQLAEEQQTARVPAGAAARTQLARRMGYRDTTGAKALAHFESERSHVHGEVREHFEALVLGDPTS